MDGSSPSASVSSAIASAFAHVPLMLPSGTKSSNRGKAGMGGIACSLKSCVRGAVSLTGCHMIEQDDMLWGSIMATFLGGINWCYQIDPEVTGRGKNGVDFVN